KVHLPQCVSILLLFFQLVHYSYHTYVSIFSEEAAPPKRDSYTVTTSEVRMSSTDNVVLHIT
ncbi:TPA: hypothetical protein ACQZJE_000683, partial [Klebsiella quasipneumoniae subsp. similipneumoniae]